MQPAVLGFRVHSGWAAMVAVAGTMDRPVVLLRRRVELADRSQRGTVQPYHAAEPMPLDEAQAWIDHCRSSARAMAETAIREVTAKLRPVCGVTMSSILQASGRPLPDLAGILASHALIHTAEGVIFREVLKQASERCKLTVAEPREKSLLPNAAAKLGRAEAEILSAVVELGRPLGRPWTQDEKLATISAWICLPMAA